ncbi:MAG: hypothetical protein WBW79_14505, partial [Desulfocapsaceae bacterium]
LNLQAHNPGQRGQAGKRPAGFYVRLPRSNFRLPSRLIYIICVVDLKTPHIGFHSNIVFDDFCAGTNGADQQVLGVVDYRYFMDFV